MNYSTLKTAVADWMHRSDLTTKMDTFIALFESRANTVLRTPEMETRATSTPTDEYIALPDDFLELRNIQINTVPPRLLEYASPQKIDALRLNTGLAAYYTIVGNQLQVNPSAADSEVEIAYYQTIPALSETNTTNWMIEKHELYYLMGVIQQAMFYTMDDRASMVDQQLDRMESIINKRGRGKNYGSGPLVVVAT